MNSIRIIATPPGQAPDWVREGWIGVTIPLAGKQQRGETRGVFGGPAENQGGYTVEGSAAIEALRKTSPDAADWWEENAPHALIGQLVFKREVCEVV